MKKRIVSFALSAVMMLSLAVPASAIDYSDFSRDTLREIVEDQTKNVAGLITSILPADTIKALAKDSISGLLNLSDIGELAGPILGDLLEDAISDALGIALPDSVDIGAIISDVLTNEYVTSILTSDFVDKVIDRTIDNLIDALVIEDVIGELADSVVDQIADEIWNNGNPSSKQINLILTRLEIGVWNTTGGWNTTNISIVIAAKLGLSTAGLGNTQLIKYVLELMEITVGDIDDYVDASKIDFTKIFSNETILNAVKKAIVDIATEYYDFYRPILIAKVQAKINEFKDKAKAELINELNKIFALKLSALDAWDDIEAKIISHIHDTKDYVSSNKAEIINDLKALKKIVNQVDKYSCLDLKRVNALLDHLIKCLEDKVDLVVVSTDPVAVVEKLSGNKNNLTISIVETYSDGSTKIIAEKSFSINNNAADTYEVGGYKVYVDTKGNVQIRACYFVK